MQQSLVGRLGALIANLISLMAYLELFGKLTNRLNPTIYLNFFFRSLLDVQNIVSSPIFFELLKLSLTYISRYSIISMSYTYLSILATLYLN